MIDYDRSRDDEEHYYIFKPDGSAEGPWDDIQSIPRDIEGQVVGVNKDVFLTEDFKFVFEWIDEDENQTSGTPSDRFRYLLLGFDGVAYGPYYRVSDIPDHTHGFIAKLDRDDRVLPIDPGIEGWEYDYELNVTRQRSDGSERQTATYKFLSEKDEAGADEDFESEDGGDI